MFQDVFWTSYVPSIYVLCPGGNFLILVIPKFNIKDTRPIIFFEINYINTLRQIFKIYFPKNSRQSNIFRSKIKSELKLMNIDIFGWCLGIIDGNFRFYYYVNITEFINFYFPWNRQKTIGFLMTSGGIEVNSFAHIRSELEIKLGDDHLFKLAQRDHLQILLEIEANSSQLIQWIPLQVKLGVFVVSSLIKNGYHLVAKTKLWSWWRFSENCVIRKSWKTVIVKTVISLDTRLKLNVHMRFKKRWLHLLNVLCTFNLISPVIRPFISMLSTLQQITDDPDYTASYCKVKNGCSDKLVIS